MMGHQNRATGVPLTKESRRSILVLIVLMIITHGLGWQGVSRFHAALIGMTLLVRAFAAAHCSA